MTPVLAITDLSKSFGGVHALRSATLKIRAEGITSVIGPNGAGKSTLLNVVSGYATPTAGTVELDGARISGLPPWKLCRIGLARSYQNLQMFPDMPAWEVIATGMYRHQSVGVLADLFCLPSSRAEQSAAERASREMLAYLGIGETYWTRRAGDLAYGLQRKLEIGRALATRPRILLLDEPAAGLATAETRALGELLQNIAASGIGIVLVEHDLDLVMSISDGIYVMDAGTVIAHGDAETIKRDPRVIAAYLGDGGHA